MRILTVRQPWAWAIIHGGKDIENRTRNIAGSYRGPVAIHVAKSEDEQFRANATWTTLMRAMDSCEQDHLEQYGPMPHDDAPWWDRFGAIVGVVDLIGVHRDEGPGPHDGTDAVCCESPWSIADHWHLVLEHPRPLTTPIPFKGALGLRELDADTEVAIWEQVSR